MKEQRKTPKLRFPGFTDDWEQRKLNEVADKVSEKNKNNEFSEPFTNSAEQGIISQKDYFDREIVNNENLNGYYIVRNDDFIYNPRISVTAPVGPINRNRLGRNGVMSPLYTVFRTHDIDNLYLEFYFKTTKWHRFMKLNGDSGARFDRFTISSTQFMEMPIPYPTLEEQQKIGEYFDSLDHLITLHQRKCNAIKELKKGMLQKMFPKNGEKVPEVRFPGFTDDWEQRKLSDVTACIKNGYTYKADGNRDHRYKITRIESISSGVINTEKLGSSDEINENYRLVDGDILFSHINSLPYIANTALYTADLGEIYHGMNLLNIRSRHEEIDSHFLLHLLKKESTRDWFRIIAKPAVNQASISTTEVGAFAFLIPRMEEQKKISSVLDNLDRLITLHQRKVEKLKEMKKGLLQQMFV